MRSKPSLRRRMLLGQISILLIFSTFAAVNFAWNFYKEQGDFHFVLENFAKRFGPLVDRYVTDQPSKTELQNIGQNYANWAADDVSIAKLNKPAAETGLKIILAVQAKNGDEIFRNDAINPNVQFLPLTQGLHQIHLDGRDWTIVSTPTPNGNHSVIFGEPSDIAAKTVFLILLEYIVVPLAIFIPIAVFLTGFVVRFGLLPLNRLTETISKRDPDNLNPLRLTKSYTETAPLVDAINVLMEKVSGSLAKERNFLADAAHELRTPLAVIQAQAHLLEIAETKSERKVAARELDRGIGRAASLIAKLLTSAQLNSDEFKFESEPLEINALVQERIAALSVLAIKKNIDLSFHQTQVLDAALSKTLFISAFDNILENAIRYTPPYGAVAVSIRNNGESQFVVAVLDSGPGIDFSKIEKVFDRFYRLEGTEQHGSGLGLSIARQAMHAHQGDIKLQPGPKGIGLLAELSGPLILSQP